MKGHELDQLLLTDTSYKETIDWMAALPDAAPWQLWQQCPRGEWMLWAAGEAGVKADVLAPIAYRIADRAVRVTAVDALEAAGLTEQASDLRALAPITDTDSAGAARDAALAVSDAAGSAAARDAAWAARSAAGAASDAAGSAWDARSAAWAARAAARAAWDAGAAWDDGIAGRDAARAAEHRLQSRWVREALPWPQVREAMRASLGE